MDHNAYSRLGGGGGSGPRSRGGRAERSRGRRAEGAPEKDVRGRAPLVYLLDHQLFAAASRPFFPPHPPQLHSFQNGWHRRKVPDRHEQAPEVRSHTCNQRFLLNDANHPIHSRLTLDPSKPQLTAEQKSALKNNVQIMRDAIVLFTATGAARGVSGHTGTRSSHREWALERRVLRMGMDGDNVSRRRWRLRLGALLSTAPSLSS